jgi:LytS/YehU family sensor histidine kinase
MDEIYKLIILLVFIIFIYTLTDLALYTYNQYAIEQIQEIRTNRELVSLQFEVLKKQLSPHFLFNSLNTASSMLYRDVELTESFIRKLVYSYQKIFSSVKENLISLAGELDIVSAYTYLMEIRFEDAVKVDINIDKNLHDKMIPPLSLQLLVENAIKHNLINDKQPLHVIIFNEKDDYLVVKNNCISRPYYINVENKLVENPNQQSTKVGLKNLQSRYRFFTRKKIFIEKNNDFIVKIPLLTDDQEPNMSNYTEPTNNKEVIF